MNYSNHAHLILRMGNAALAYADAVRRLSQCAPATPMRDYDERKTHAQAAYLRFQAARLAMELYRTDSANWMGGDGAGGAVN